jgi:hypothetical protein
MTATSLRIPEQNLHRGCRQLAFRGCHKSKDSVMRARHVIASAFILVLVGVKLTFLAVPIAEADARSIESGGVDVLQIHQNVGKLPVQNVHDMSFVFPSPAA